MNHIGVPNIREAYPSPIHPGGNVDKLTPYLTTQIKKNQKTHVPWKKWWAAPTTCGAGRRYAVRAARYFCGGAETFVGASPLAPPRSYPSRLGYTVRAASHYNDTPLFHGIKSSCTCRTEAISISPLATPIT